MLALERGGHSVTFQFTPAHLIDALASAASSWTS